MIYLQGLSNLQLTKVADYLDPIIRDETQNEDTRFLAIWATIPLAHTRAEKVKNSFTFKIISKLLSLRHTRLIGHYSKIEMHHYRLESLPSKCFCFQILLQLG